MRIALVAHGYIPVPPPAGGAIEIVVWDMFNHLTKAGHKVLIVNTPNHDELISSINNFKPDIVHIHWEPYFFLTDRIHCKNVLVTGHHAGLPYVADKVFHSGRHKIVTLTPEIRQKYLENGCDPSKLILMPNAIDEEQFYFNPICMYPNKSAYLAFITERKRQFIYQHIPDIYFIGKHICQKFNQQDRNLGEWNKQNVYMFLTCFANLVLLSEAECHPLVTCEALICGLGVVASESAAGNLDRSKPWITVIPNDKLYDLQFVEDAIRNNRKMSIIHRQEIRKYGLEKFSWTARTPEIIKTYKTILDEQS